MVVRQQIDKFNQYIPYPQYLKLLLRATDATATGIKDFSGYGRVVTNASSVTGSTTQIKFNPYSFYFDGVSDTISVPDAAEWDFGTSDFTVAWWEYRTADLADNAVISRASAGFSPFIFGYGGGIVYISSNGSGWDIANAKTIGTNVLNSWQHICIERSGSTFITYRNGIQQDTWTSTASIYPSTSALIIGIVPSQTNSYQGYIDNIAIWSGIAIPISQLYPQSKPFSFRRA